MFKKVAVISILVALCGCASQPALIKQTESGKSEAEYPGKTKAQVKDALVVFCSSKGLNVFEASEGNVICGKQTDSILAQMMVGNAYSTPAIAKMRFTIASVDNTPKVWGDMWIESQMPGGQVNQMPSTNNGDRNSLQSILDNLRP